MRRIFLYLLILCSFSAGAQSLPGHFNPITSPYDYSWLRVKYLRLPTSVNVSNPDTGAIRYLPATMQTQVWTGLGWKDIGGSVDTVLMATRARVTQQLDSMKGTIPTIYSANGTLSGPRRILAAGNPYTFWYDDNNYDSATASGYYRRRGNTYYIQEDKFFGLQARREDYRYGSYVHLFNDDDSSYGIAMFSENANLYNWKQSGIQYSWKNGVGLNTNVYWKYNDVDTSYKYFRVKPTDTMGVGAIEVDPELLPDASASDAYVWTYNDADKRARKKLISSIGGGSGGGEDLQATTDLGATTTTHSTFSGGITTNKLSLTAQAVDPSTSPGDIVYNNTTNTLRANIAGAMRNLLTEGSIGYITGKVITVDKDAANATDVRAGISKYNSFYPFKTIAAAAATMADGDVLYVSAGDYGNDSLELTYSDCTCDLKNTVYFDRVTMTGDIRMRGKMFLTNSTLNSHVYMYASGSSDIAAGNLIAGLDKGSSVINGRIQVGAWPGANYMTLRHLGKISSPASGYGSGITLESGTNTTWTISGISIVENKATGSGSELATGGTFSWMDIGQITSEKTGGGAMLYGTQRMKNVRLVRYKGTECIAGGYFSMMQYAEDVYFENSNSPSMFQLTAYNGESSSTFKNCSFKNTYSGATWGGGYCFFTTYSPSGPAQNKSVYFYNCQFQLNNNSGANYPIYESGGDDILNIHWINNISNQNTSTFISGQTSPPVISIVAGYVNSSSFVISTPPVHY